MNNTKYDKIDFRKIDFIDDNDESQVSTNVNTSTNIITIKVAKSERKKDSFLCSRKINLVDLKMKDAYRRVNKMLGGY